MENFSEEFLTEVLKFYKSIGLNKSDFFKADNILGMYQILGIKPEFDEFGNRRLTPYEILGVPPIIVNGREIPIVFAIKNKSKKIKRIGTTDGPVVDFVYKNKKVQEKDSLLEQLKKQYIQALLAGDEDLAAQFLQMIDEITGGRSVEVLHSFYDYTKFYRRMKKQLLIDLFNHFFLMYLLQNSVNIKNGIIKKGKVYKAFRDENEQERQEEIPDFQMGQRLLGGKGGPRISKISVSRGDMDMPPAKPRPRESFEASKPVVNKPPVEKEEREENFGRKSSLNKRRRFGRFRKFEPFEDSFEQTAFAPPPPTPMIDAFEDAFQNVVEDQIAKGIEHVKGALDNQFDPLAFDPTFNRRMMGQDIPTLDNRVMEGEAQVFKDFLPDQQTPEQLADIADALTENKVQGAAEIQKEL